MSIHPTAILHPSLSLPGDVEVGPYALIDEDVAIGSGVVIGPFSHLHPGTRLEDRVILSDGVVVGGPPQDLKYRGEKTGVQIGRGTRLREYVTVNRGTAASGTTQVGADCLLMAYTHVGHDCEVGDRVIIANAVHLGGHVRIGEGAVISGITGINQFVTIGAGAFIGGGLRAIKDVLPFSKGLGDPMRYGGINPMGLEKLGFPAASGAWIKSAYRMLSSEGKPALLEWLATSGASSFQGLGEGEKAALAALLVGFLSTQTRSILVRPAGLGSGMEEGSGSQPD